MIPASVPSYDSKQMAAVLKQCADCRLWFYFTNHQADRCAWCR